jgi:hypothetical protein
MAHSDGDPLQVIPMKIVPESPPGGEAQATNVVGDELEAPKVNDFVAGEATACQALSTNGDNEHDE